MTKQRNRKGHRIIFLLAKTTKIILILVVKTGEKRGIRPILLKIAVFWRALKSLSAEKNLKFTSLQIHKRWIVAHVFWATYPMLRCFEIFYWPKKLKVWKLFKFKRVAVLTFYYYYNAKLRSEKMKNQILIYDWKSVLK